jgi:RNA ligase
MTKLWDIPGFTQELYFEMREQKYVNMRSHPEHSLFILNYSDKAQIDDVWNPVTMNCRGLIIDVFSNIVARPFKKFFNYGQKGAAEISLDEPVIVTDKADGSLGIIYPTGDGYAVATRGSFVSEQAIKATEMLQDTAFFPHPGITTLVEIIYPENRIVLDYGQEEKLVMLGGVSIDSGHITSPGTMARYNGWVTRNVTQTFSYKTLADALAAEPRKNAEGLVVRAAGGRMVKLKQEDYIKLHRLVTGLNERVVWEYLKDHNGEYEGLLEGLPDEFHGWVREKAAMFLLRFDVTKELATRAYHEIIAEPIDRKAFAARAQEWPKLRGYLFVLFDDKNIDGMIWKSLRPVGQTQQMKAISEDVA